MRNRDNKFREENRDGLSGHGPLYRNKYSTILKECLTIVASLKITQYTCIQYGIIMNDVYGFSFSFLKVSHVIVFMKYACLHVHFSLHSKSKICDTGKNPEKLLF